MSFSDGTGDRGRLNNWLQARPGYALLFVLAPRPGLPEPRRWQHGKKMRSQNRIASIAHSTAHHAVSGVCFVNPHLRRACIGLGRLACKIDLLADTPCPSEFLDIEPIHLSVSALRDTFVAIAKSEGFNPTDFKEAVLVYEFPPHLNDYSGNCCVSIISSSGYSVTKAVDYRGNGAELFNKETEPGAATEPPPAGAHYASREKE